MVDPIQAWNQVEPFSARSSQRKVKAESGIKLSKQVVRRESNPGANRALESS
jgi:hypothetical protein